MSLEEFLPLQFLGRVWEGLVLILFWVFGRIYQWSGTSSAGATGSIPGWRTKIPHVVWPGKRKKKQNKNQTKYFREALWSWTFIRRFFDHWFIFLTIKSNFLFHPDSVNTLYVLGKCPFLLGCTTCWHIIVSFLILLSLLSFLLGESS